MKHYITVAFACLFLIASCSKQKTPQTSTEASAVSPETAVEVVRFANLPYGDHTYSEIGVQKGFFKDANIDIKTETIKIEEVVPDLVNGRFDVASVPPGILFASYDTAPQLRTFVFGDLFQGYALMASSTGGMKRYSDFRAEGMDHDAAVAATVKQIIGHTFAYPTETAIKPFIDLLLSKGGVSRDQFKALVLDDPLTVNAMRRGQAQFQVGGVPSRITLQKEGFVPLISSVDLARGAKSSADSPELASVLQNGWATTAKFYDDHHAAILRLASVNYRIMKFMATNREEAIKIHMGYLSRVTGEPFTPEDGKIIYDDLDPFFTFEDQRPWFHDKQNSLYYEYVNGAILNSFKSAQIYKGKPPSVEDVIFSGDIYKELENLRDESSSAFTKLEPMKSALSAKQQDLLTEARKYFDSCDFYDSVRLLHQVHQ